MSALNQPDDASDSQPSPDKPARSRRWYDEDPALLRVVEQLKQASDKHQAQVALNIIKIIVEHQIEQETQVSCDNLGQILQGSAGENSSEGINNQRQGLQHRRWYDVHEALRSAMHMLEDCPTDLQRQMVPLIARMTEQTLGDTDASLD